jgi:hypothetical protein
MSVEKKDPCALKVVSEDLTINPESLYGKVLRICKLEADSNVYDEDIVGHFMNINSKLEASLEGEDRDFLIEGFSFLRESEDVVVAILLRDFTNVDYSGTREFLSPGEAGNFEYFEDRVMQGDRPQGMMSTKIHMIYDPQEKIETSRRESDEQMMKGENPGDRAYVHKVLDNNQRFFATLDDANKEDNTQMFVREKHIDKAREEMENDFAQREAEKRDKDNFYTHDYFFSLYPVYLQISDPDRIQEIEDIVSRIEDREVVPV